MCVTPDRAALVRVWRRVVLRLEFQKNLIFRNEYIEQLGTCIMHALHAYPYGRGFTLQTEATFSFLKLLYILHKVCQRHQPSATAISITQVKS
jgi:hypothetical protein